MIYSGNVLFVCMDFYLFSINTRSRILKYAWETVVAQRYQRVIVNATVVGSISILHLYFHFFALVSRQSAALSSATQHAMPDFGGKWGMECLNTRFPLPTLLCAGYSVRLILYILNKVFT